MINKSRIILPSDDDEIKLVISRACDLYTKAERSLKPFYTKFLSPLESAVIMQRFPKNEIGIKTFGGYDDSERCVCAFFTYEEDLAFPITALQLKIKGKASSLNHRDYLGSLLSVGIKREVIGDIVVSHEGAMVFCLDEIADYICDNLTKVGGTGIDVKREASLDEINVKREFQISSSTVSSLRCDSVIASALNLSRSKAAELIERGLATRNYEQLKSLSASANDGDVFSVRGYGKFKLQTDGHLTKKGRIHVNICKYI